MRLSSNMVQVTVALTFVTIVGCSTDNAISVFSGAPGKRGGDNSGEVGGAGGFGGASGTGGVMVSAVSSSSSTSASSSSGTPVDPQACGTCVFQACQQEVIACGQACQTYAGCVQNCTDSACAQACVAQTPEAKPVYACSCAKCSATCGSWCDSGTSTSSSSSSGMPTCSTCSQLLQGNVGQPCPGSDKLLQNLLVCTCQQSCATECTTTCQTGAQDQTCFGCISQKCGAQLTACFQD